MGLEVTIQINSLIIAKPDLQVGLTDIIPPGETPSHYLNRYQAEYKVRCAFCDSHMPHNRGFTVQMEDGRTALCGKDCATKYFGKEVADNHEQELEKQIKRATKRKIIERTLDGLPAAQALLTDDWIEMERLALKAVRALTFEFRYSKIQSGLTEQGHFELKDVRRRWVEREDEFGRTKRVPVDEERLVLKVVAASILRGRGDSVSPVRLERVRQSLDALLAVKTETELSDAVVDRMTAMRGKIISDIRNAVSFLDLCAQFFTKENIKALSSLTKHVQTTADKFALHKRPSGFDLIITSEGSSLYRMERDNETHPIPDFGTRPTAEVLLAPLKDDHAQE